jgi:hypothetical protein
VYPPAIIAHWFVNEADQPITLMIEPWGRTYLIAPKARIEMRLYRDVPRPAVSIVYHSDLIAIWIESSDCDALQLFENGREITLSGQVDYAAP